jgi:hypothetical protein
MAGRLIVMKNIETAIEGDVEAAGYEKWIELESLSFGAGGFPDYSAKELTGSAHQSAITAAVKFGPWMAELQQRLYHGTALGEVNIVDLRQKVSGGQKTWEKIRELKLLDPFIEKITQTWNGIQATAVLHIDYKDMTYSSGMLNEAKHAHFERSQKTKS